MEGNNNIIDTVIYVLHFSFEILANIIASIKVDTKIKNTIPIISVGPANKGKM